MLYQLEVVYAHVFSQQCAGKHRIVNKELCMTPMIVVIA